MAVPKRRQSTTRRDKRRSHDAITLPNTVLCPQCGEPKLPHRVCPSCGTYKGRQDIDTEE
jgi:large subunit ribosomal protein L32